MWTFFYFFNNFIFLYLKNQSFALTFDYLLILLKHIILSNEEHDYTYELIPNLQSTLIVDKEEKPPDQVLRKYGYNYLHANIYSNLNEWETLSKETFTPKKGKIHWSHNFSLS